MPQMAPMGWLTLFMTFSMMMILTTTMNYYLYTPQIKMTKTMKQSNNTMNWKW